MVSGGGSVWAPGSWHVPVESACSTRAVYVLLASPVCSADLHIFQHPRPAHFQGEVAFPFSHQVNGVYIVIFIPNVSNYTGNHFYLLVNNLINYITVKGFIFSQMNLVQELELFLS